jgi:hypothetical protein
MFKRFQEKWSKVIESTNNFRTVRKNTLRVRTVRDACLESASQYITKSASQYITKSASRYITSPHSPVEYITSPHSPRGLFGVRIPIHYEVRISIHYEVRISIHCEVRIPVHYKSAQSGRIHYKSAQSERLVWSPHPNTL